ncbi:MAG: DUF998 domain-containing protein [Thermoplasmata archaeon]|nr:DUF998 domain-containing protein [Thermoplasmata archaeon]
MDGFGPLVPRTARWGGVLLAVGSLQFILAMVIVQWKFPGYSDFGNYVSDLGGPASPWAWLFNDSIRVLAVLGIVGTVLMRGAFPSKTMARAGLAFLVIAALAAFAVGTFPESNLGDREDALHSWASSITFLGSGLALLLLGIGTFRDTRWAGYRTFTFLLGIATFVGIGLFDADPGGLADVGLWERVIIAPILLWGILAGLHLARLPAFAPARSTI